MLLTEQQTRHNAIHAAAEQMLLAARTAPKGKGRDTLVLAAAFDDTLLAIAEKMEELSGTLGKFLLRDAGNVRASQGIVLLGTTVETLGMMNCGFCGLQTCANKNTYSEVPCAFNMADLGIAIGSAVSVAAQMRVDTRVMFSAGKAALALGLLGENVKVAFGIPLSCSAKSPFFDR